MAKKIIAGSAKASRRKSRKKASAIQARRKKEFLYRGYNMEQLLAMPFDELLTLLPSRARRTYNRGLNYEQQLLLYLLRGTAFFLSMTSSRAFLAASTFMPRIIPATSRSSSRRWSDMASERKFVAENIRRVLLKEYLMKEVSR